MNIPAILGLLLALSVAGNAWLFHERDKSIAAVATAEQINTDTRNAANTCSASVESLATESRTRQKRIGADVAALAAPIAALQGQANRALQAKPDNPADLCGSLERYWRARLIDERSGAVGQGAKP